MSLETRTELAAAQAQLLRALAKHEPPPEGFDPARFQAAASALAAKRCRTVARAWPALAKELGEGFVPCFGRYAQLSPLPRAGGPLADGRAFARILAAEGELTDPARLECLAVDLRYTASADGLIPRRCPAIRGAFLRQSRRLVLAVRLPWLGERWLSLPLRVG